MIKIKTDDEIEELSVKEIISHNEEIVNEKIGELLMKGHSEETIEDFEQMSKIE